MTNKVSGVTRFGSISSIGAVAAVALGAILSSVSYAAACEPHKIDVGGGKSISSDCSKLRIAFFSGGSNNVYIEANIQGAKDATKKYDASIEVIDSNWSASTEYNQLQTVLTSGKYNAVIMGAVDGVQMCKITTEDAPAKNFLVASYNQPLCGKALKEGDELWAPGLVSFVGGAQTRTAFLQYFEMMAKENPGPQKVLVLTGPDLNANSLNTDAAVKDIMAKYPDFKVLSVTRTNYTVVDGNQKTLPLLQANPDVTILFANYSEITRGAVQALKQAGMAGKVKVYDTGGNVWAFNSVKNGDVVATKALLPYTELQMTVDSMAQAWFDKPGPHFLELPSSIVTKENIAQYKPEY